MELNKLCEILTELSYLYKTGATVSISMAGNLLVEKSDTKDGYNAASINLETGELSFSD